jgi:hypothetical protein
MIDDHAGLAELERIWSGPVDDPSQAAYIRLLDTYKIEAAVAHRAYSLADGVIGDIRESELESPQKEVLIAWLKMSFKDIGDEAVLAADYSDALTVFLRALAELTHDLVFPAVNTVRVDTSR